MAARERPHASRRPRKRTHRTVRAHTRRQRRRRRARHVRDDVRHAGEHARGVVRGLVRRRGSGKRCRRVRRGLRAVVQDSALRRLRRLRGPEAVDGPYDQRAVERRCARQVRRRKGPPSTSRPLWHICSNSACNSTRVLLLLLLCWLVCGMRRRMHGCWYAATRTTCWRFCWSCSRLH